MTREATTLLSPDDPAPFDIDNVRGRSPFLLVGDHAGSGIPESLGDLSLNAADRARHIAVDIGTRGVGRALAQLLDAPFIHQTYSRLVIDCNRDPGHEDAIAIQSDGTSIIGNSALDDADRQARTEAVHTPYHAAISAMLDARQAADTETILLSLHSFTPQLDGFIRPWHVGVLHWLGRTDFAMAMVEQLRGDKAICVGDNAPYSMDATDYTVPLHAFPRKLRYAEIEIRQDLISDHSGQVHWAEKIQKAATSAWR